MTDERFAALWAVWCEWKAAKAGRGDRALHDRRTRFLAGVLDVDLDEAKAFRDRWRSHSKVKPVTLHEPARESEHDAVGSANDSVGVDDHGPDERVVTGLGTGPARSLQDLLNKAGVDESIWRVTNHKINEWGNEEHPYWQVKASLERRVEAVFRRVQVSEVVRRPAPKPGKIQRALLIPDMHVGHRWVDWRRDSMTPLHDRRAMDCVAQIAEHWRPDETTQLGDVVDFPVFSTRFPRPPNLEDLTNHATHEANWWLRRLGVDWITGGNHGERLNRYLVERAGPLVELQAVGDPRPLVTLQRLLALEDIGVEWVGDYDSTHWLWGKVACHHGEAYGKHGGDTVKKLTAAADHHEVVGHSHKLEMAHRTRHGPDGPEQLACVSAGCLCHIDGRVPGIDRPYWQQGFATAVKCGDRIWFNIHEIHDGACYFDGRLFQGADPVEQIRDDLGLGMLAA